MEYCIELEMGYAFVSWEKLTENGQRRKVSKVNTSFITCLPFLLILRRFLHLEAVPPFRFRTYYQIPVRPIFNSCPLRKACVLIMSYFRHGISNVSPFSLLVPKSSTAVVVRSSCFCGDKKISLYVASLVVHQIFLVYPAIRVRVHILLLCW